MVNAFVRQSHKVLDRLKIPSLILSCSVLAAKLYQQVNSQFPLFKLRWLFGDLARSRWFFPSSERSAEGESEITFAALRSGGFTPITPAQDMVHCSIPGTTPSLTWEVFFMQRKGHVFIKGLFSHPKPLPSLRINLVS